ncbi:MAG: hypothetical protein JWM74_2504, partial [Myxococcaceae bacterium]|nr:hypothetical protein [Myxococcaceae bacterium]
PDVAKGLDPDDFRKWFSSSLVSHEITNRMTGKCVDVNLATTRVEQWSCFDTQPQRFGLVDVGGGSWEIHAGNSGECVRADAQYPVKPGACDGSSATRWWVSSVGDDYYQIHNRQMSDWCLDIPGGSGADGFALQVYPCHTGQNQQFRFDARFRNTVQQLRPVGSSLVVDVAGGTAGNGQPLQLHTRHGYPNQQWTLGALGGDDASASPLSGLAECIDVPWGSTADGVTLQQWQCHGGDNQRLQARWREGAYVFRFKSSNKCLSVPTTGLATSGTLLEQRTCDASGSTQRWELY